MKLTRNRILKPLVFAACIALFVQLAIGLYLQAGGHGTPLGADPVARITHKTGWFTLVLLLVTLAITPVRKLTGLNWLIQYRRMIGLFAFFYACLHFLTYLVLDQAFDIGSIAHDLGKRPFIFAGTTAFLLLVPLAITSTQGWIRRLGKNWVKLHRLIYVSAIVAVIHFIWLVKKDISEPLMYAGILAVLLGYRVVVWAQKQTRTAVRSPERQGVGVE